MQKVLGLIPSTRGKKEVSVSNSSSPLARAWSCDKVPELYPWICEFSTLFVLCLKFLIYL